MHRLAILAIVATTMILDSSCTGLGNKDEATIPFEFHIGAIPMRAGTYKIQAEKRLLSFTNLSDLKHSDFVAVDSREKLGPPAKILFHRYGTQYFLSETVNARGETEMTFLPSRAEMSLRMEAGNLWSRSQVLVSVK